jgi:hypothetical protein
MIINVDYDLTKPIQSAIKAKAPYVGVPMPGHAPLIFKRSLLAGALKGVKPVYIEVNVLESGLRVLTVEGTAGPRVRTRCSIYSIRREQFRLWGSEVKKAMDKWKPTMTLKVKAPKSTKFDKAIIVLEKRLAKLGDRPRLYNPAIATGYHSSDRESCLKWYQQKSLRGQVGALGKQTRTGGMDSRQFYTAMDALPGIGKVTRYSELDTQQKESIKRDIRDTFGRNGFLDYANPKMLWRFMPNLKTWCGGKPYGLQPLGEDYQDEPRWGAKRYEPVLEWQRERKEILSAIASIREMQVEVIPAPPTFQEFMEQIAA